MSIGKTENSNSLTASYKPMIAYEDNEIRVIWHPGNSDFLAITFGDLATLANGVKFAADTAIIKLEINCIGFMAKTPNWFPSDSMNAAIKSISPTLQRFKTRVTYGGSMGGYAALKYSNILQATSVIAFCPQWTLDSKECGSSQPGYQSFYRESMSGMGIRPSDISGSLFLFYDPHHKEDAYHGSKIRSIESKAKFFPVRSADHYVTMILAGTTHLSKIFQLVINNDLDQLSALVGKIRRGHPRRKRILLSRLINSHPLLLEGILRNSESISFLSEQELTEINSSLLSLLINTHSHRHSIRTAERLTNLNICAGRKKILYRLIDSLSFREVILSRHITTAHRKLLTYNVITGKLHQAADTLLSLEGGYEIPVTKFPLQLTEALGITIGGIPHFLIINKSGDAALVDIYSAEFLSEKLVKIERDEVADTHRLRLGTNYVTAEPGGAITFNRTEAKGWEAFSVT